MRVVLPALVLAFLAACGGTSAAADSGGDPGGDAGNVATLTLSGTLVAGSQASTTVRSLPAAKASALQAGDPLAGYRLYCVTFAVPPLAAAATADADGKVALELDAAGVPFGCFVLDTAGDGVATLMFTKGAEEGQTLTLSGDADLGGITVDLDHQVAHADVASTGALTASGGLPCPLGTWVVTVPRGDCTGTATATIWFVRTETGALRASFTLGPVQLSGTDGLCGDVSQADLAVTEGDLSLTFAFPHDPVGCPSRMDTVVLTPNADCTQMAAVSSFGPCLACGDGQCGCQEGTLDCTLDFTVSRQ
jgi:hypothetical protein